MKKSPHLHFFLKIWARNLFLLFGPIAMCHFRHCEIFFGITLSAKTVTFLEIKCQTFCSHTVAFLFSKATEFDLLL